MIFHFPTSHTPKSYVQLWMYETLYTCGSSRVYVVADATK